MWLEVTGKEEGDVTGRVVALVVAAKLKSMFLSKTDPWVIFGLEFKRKLIQIAIESPANGAV